jgi:hypothetical protein
MISAKKSYKDGHVSLRVTLKASGWRRDSVKVEGNTELSSEQARELAKALLDEAERADAKVAAKAASDARRKKWRDREIASGRMKIISLR